MVQLGSHFILLALCLAVAAHPATNGMVAEHETSFKHTRRFHRARIHNPRYDDGRHNPGYPTATYDEGQIDLTYPTAPHTNEQYAAPSQSPSATQGSASSIYATDGRYYPGYLNATYDNMQVHAGPTAYNNEKYAPQTADQASQSSNSPAGIKTFVVAIAGLPTLSAPSVTSSPATKTTTSAQPEIPAPATTTSAEGASTGTQRLLAPAAAATALSDAEGLLTSMDTPADPSNARNLVVLMSPTSPITTTTSGRKAVATDAATTPGTVPAAASIAGGIKRPQDDNSIYRIGKSRQKRADDDQDHTDLRFDNTKYHPGKSHEKRFDDGQYLPDSKFEDSQYHPNGDNGEHHLGKASQKLSDEDRYHPSSIYEDDRKYHSGKRNNRRVPVS